MRSRHIRRSENCNIPKSINVLRCLDLLRQYSSHVPQTPGKTSGVAWRSAWKMTGFSPNFRLNIRAPPGIPPDMRQNMWQRRSFRRSFRRFWPKYTAKHAAAPFIPPHISPFNYEKRCHFPVWGKTRANLSEYARKRNFSEVVQPGKPRAVD